MTSRSRRVVTLVVPTYQEAENIGAFLRVAWDLEKPFVGSDLLYLGIR